MLETFFGGTNSTPHFASVFRTSHRAPPRGGRERERGSRASRCADTQTTHNTPPHTQRLAAFDAAVRVVDASPSAWAAPLAADAHRALRRALCLGAPPLPPGAGSDVTSAASAPSPSKAAAAAALADTASSRPAGSPLRRPSGAAAATAASPPRRAPSWRLGSAVKALSLRRASSPAAAESASTIPARPPPRPPPRPPNPAAAAAAAAALAAAAPATRGDVGPAEWVGLLVALTAAAGAGADPTPPVAYLARACKRMFGGDAATALDVATEALAPALALLRRGASTLPPPGLERALATAAPSAVAAAETAVRDRHAPGLGWRARRGATAAALRVLSVVLATDSDGVACVAAGLAADGADARYTALATAAGGGAAGLAAVADAAAVDVAADAETLAAAARGDGGTRTPPATAAAALAREASRVYCVRLKADIDALLSSAARRAVDAGFIKLVVATHALAAAATPHAPSAARALGGGDAPPFAPSVCAWLDGAASKLARWPARALAADGDAGLPPVVCADAGDHDPPTPPPRCRASLVDLCAALLALADDCAPLAAAHPLYAASLERALAAAVSAHAAALDAAATTALAPPRRAAGRAAAAARLGAAARAAAAGLPAGTPPRGCLAALSDLRELRPRVDGLAATLRASLPPGWWGGRAGPGLGAALRVARADAARRYEAAVAAAAASAAVPLRAPLAHAANAAATAAAAPPADRAAAASTAADAVDALATSLADTLAAVAAGADARVARALARGVWSELAAAATAPLGGGAAADTAGLAYRAAGASAVLACLDGAARRAGGLAVEEAPPRVARAVADVDRFLRD